MATEFHKAQRKALAFAGLGAARDALAEFLGIDADPAPPLTGAAARDQETVHVHQTERITDFLTRLFNHLQENMVESDGENESVSSDLETALLQYRLEPTEGEEPETPSEILFRLLDSLNARNIRISNLEDELAAGTKENDTLKAASASFEQSMVELNKQIDELNKQVADLTMEVTRETAVEAGSEPKATKKAK
jgi:hypothetical protein